MIPLLLLFTMLGGTGLAADRAEPNADAFLNSARDATARYKDRSLAIADGYRLIGSDFPAMGEHWIHIGLLFDGLIEAEHPEVLTYANINGVPELLGVAWVLPLLPGETAPDYPAGRSAWHDHFRTLEDETVLPQHHTSGSGGESARLAMLHAWIWLPNPAGVFAADNWALPFHRLGIPPGQQVPPDSGKALSLLSGGDGYYRAALTASVRLTARESRKIGETISHARAKTEIIARGRSQMPLTEAQLDELSAVWNRMWTRLEGVAPAPTRNAIQSSPLR